MIFAKRAPAAQTQPSEEVLVAPTAEGAPS
jgi:hypothetical protein